MGESRQLNIEQVPAAILAGGLATRLGALAAKSPKAMLDIDGRPFVEHQLSLLARHGIGRVVLCVGHMGEMIERHVGNGSRFNLNVQYSYDGPALDGTGGAIRRALPLLGGVFWVMYGDSYMDIDYRAVLAQFSGCDARALMTVFRNDNALDPSNALFENGQLKCYSKTASKPGMHYIDYGVQLIRRSALASIPSDCRCDLADLYHDLVERGQMVGCEVFNRFYEIGTPASLEETRRFLGGQSSPLRRAS